MPINLSPYQLVAFDKDGTLLDFDAMWGGWIETLAQRLEAASGLEVTPALYRAMGYDPAARRALSGQPLAVASMGDLQHLCVAVLEAAGVPADAAREAVAAAWHVPDPVASARPLADLPRLFGRLRRTGLAIAVVTTDDRGPTVATLEKLEVLPLVAAVVCADDGLPIKPEPDMLRAACRQAGVEPARAIMVGDSGVDMQMARAAGAGLAVGVTSGTSSADDLRPIADLVVPSINHLLDNHRL